LIGDSVSAELSVSIQNSQSKSQFSIGVVDSEF